MNSEAIARVLGAVRYKSGWKLRWSSSPSKVSLWWQMEAPDYTKPGMPMMTWQCREWVLFDPVTEDKLVKTALAAALQAEEHECREAFTYRGVRLFDPHLTVQQLMEAACPST